MTTFIVVRHGQSEGNHNQVFQGQGEFPLTETGRKQAQATADYLKKIKIHACFSSDLTRAADTARYIASSQGIALQEEKALREVDVGAWQGVRYDEVWHRYPDEWNTWLNDIGNARCTGGESMRQLQNRSARFFEKCAVTYKDKTVCIVTHGAVIRSMVCVWRGLDITHMKQVEFFKNASVSMVQYHDDGTKEILVLNEHQHMQSLATEFPNTI